MASGSSNQRAVERPSDHANIDAGGVRYSDCWGLAFNPGPVHPYLTSKGYEFLADGTAVKKAL